MSRPVRLTIATTTGVEIFSVAMRGSLLVAVTPRVQRAGASEGTEGSPWKTIPVKGGSRSSARRNLSAASPGSVIHVIFLFFTIGVERHRGAGCRTDDADPGNHTVGLLRNGGPTTVHPLLMPAPEVLHRRTGSGLILRRQARAMPSDLLMKPPA